MPVRPWLRFGAVVTARAVFAVLLSLTFWAVAPLALGWQTTTVMTGSMAPAINPGDLVVTRPIPDGALRPGQVLLTQDPDHAGWLRLHRLHTVRGTELITKGDANPEPDSSPVHRGDVIGVGYLRVPWIGNPIRDARDGNITAVTVTLLGLCVVVAAAVAPATARQRGVDRDSDEENNGNGSARSAPGRGRHRAAFQAPAAIAVTAALILGIASPASATSFFASTTTSSSLRTAIAQPVNRVWCANNWDGTVTIGWNYAANPPSAFDVIPDGHKTATHLDPTARTTLIRPALFPLGGSSTIQIQTDLTPTWTATSPSSVHITTLFGVARCT